MKSMACKIEWSIRNEEKLWGLEKWEESHGIGEGGGGAKVEKYKETWKPIQEE